MENLSIAQKQVIEFYNFNIEELRKLNGSTMNGKIKLQNSPSLPANLHKSILVGHFTSDTNRCSPKNGNHINIYLKEDGWFSDINNYNYDVLEYKEFKHSFEKPHPAFCITPEGKVKGYSFYWLVGLAYTNGGTPKVWQIPGINSGSGEKRRNLLGGKKPVAKKPVAKKPVAKK